MTDPSGERDRRKAALASLAGIGGERFSCLSDEELCEIRMREHASSGIYPSKDIEAAADSMSASGGKAAALGALVVDVEPGSPADDAGFEPGCRVTHVDGHPVRDVIDWRWLSADDVACIGYVDLDGDAGEVELVRDEGEDWGFAFEGVVFDGVKQCRNACLFCFMRQLPEGMRPSLTLRDDDFRLSFLSGTFVTLTNLASEDEARILEQRISPLRVSLHAADARVRRRLMGRHAAHGLAALDRLLAAGIQVHAQIVLVPGENDGAVLEDTLAWAYARPGILNVGIVPLGFTKHQDAFARSFNDPADARAVLDAVAPFQDRALAERGTPWAFAADEFYRNAFGADLLENLPPAERYGDFGMFEDGIGIVRSYVDDWRAAHASGAAAACAEALRAAGVRARFVVGEAMQPFLDQLVEASPLAGAFAPLTVANAFFGGNVDVTGLLCGCDMTAAINRCVRAEGAGGRHAQTVLGSHETPTGRFDSCGTARGTLPPPPRSKVAATVGPPAGGRRDLFVIPRVVFNDDGLTLDDMSLKDMEKEAGVPLAVVSCNPSEFLPEIEALARHLAARA